MDRLNSTDFAQSTADGDNQAQEAPKKRGRGALKKVGVARYSSGRIIPAYKQPPTLFSITTYAEHNNLPDKKAAALARIREKFPIEKAKFYIRGTSGSAQERARRRGEPVEVGTKHRSIRWDEFAVAWLKALGAAGFSSREVALEMGDIGAGAVIRQATSIRETTGEVLFFRKKDFVLKSKKRGTTMPAADRANAVPLRNVNTLPGAQAKADAELAALRARTADFACADDPSNAATGLALLRALNSVPLPPPGERITLEATVVKDTCRWIDGDPLGDHSYCGKPRDMPAKNGVRFSSLGGVEKSPYCSTHQKVVAASASSRSNKVS